MTEQQKAVFKALVDLDGRATNSEIYAAAKRYADFGGSTPNNTIRRNLQDIPFIQPVDPEKKGEWKLDFMEVYNQNKEKDRIIAQMKKKLSDADTLLESKDLEIRYLRSREYRNELMSEGANEYMTECKDKSQVEKTNIKTVLMDMSSQLDFSYTPEVKKRLNHFNDEKAMPQYVVKKEYKDNATSADIDVAGMSSQDLYELLGSQVQLPGNKSPKQIK